MLEGVDYSWSRPDLEQLYQLGKQFIIRYVSYSDTGKNLTRAEAEQARRVGLAIVTNWEWDARDQLGGYARGQAHAREADRQHRACGGPKDRPIYFSTDFDASTGELETCYDYLRGAASIIGWDRVGVYGGYRTIAYMASKGVRWLWQTYAWSGGRWHKAAQLRQYRNGVHLAGGEVDLNRAMTDDYGQWGLSDTGGGSMIGLKLGDTGERVKGLQSALREAGFSPGEVDGIYGPKTAAALLACRKAQGSSVESGNKVSGWANTQLLIALATKYAGKGPPGKTPTKIHITGEVVEAE